MPTRKEAIEFKCWECMGNYVDGMVDCGVTACPLYQWMPYREHEPSLDLFAYDSKRRGKVVRQKKELTEEQKQALRERFATGKALSAEKKLQETHE
jgi:hypothetical protein